MSKSGVVLKAFKSEFLTIWLSEKTSCLLGILMRDLAVSESAAVIPVLKSLLEQYCAEPLMQ